MNWHPNAIEKSLPHHEMIYVEGGRFMMGNESGDYAEKPAHPVRLDSYYLGKYPVTQALWKAVMGSLPKKLTFFGDRHPIEGVSWHGAKEFIGRLNKLTNKPFRLPTEAEWEYAAQGGIHQSGYTYAGGEKLEELGWFEDNAYNETQPVGLKQPNALGLYDMSGNVWERCVDWYSRDYYAECQNRGEVLNPAGPDGGDYRVVRGGSWAYTREFCRLSLRYFNHPELRNYFIGFRLAAPSENG